MYDACVMYNISEEDKNLMGIKTGRAAIKQDLNFSKNEIAFLKPKDYGMLKEAVSKGIPFGIIDAELIFKKDSIQHIKAGIDDAIAKLMAKKKIAVVFDLKLLLETKGLSRARIIRRMKENMRRAVKYGIPILFASRAKRKLELFNGMEIKAIARYLGIDSFKMARESFEKIFNE